MSRMLIDEIDSFAWLRRRRRLGLVSTGPSSSSSSSNKGSMGDTTSRSPIGGPISCSSSIENAIEGLLGDLGLVGIEPEELLLLGGGNLGDGRGEWPRP